MTIRPATEAEIKEAAQKAKYEEEGQKIFIQAVKECMPLFRNVK